MFVYDFKNEGIILKRIVVSGNFITLFLLRSQPVLREEGSSEKNNFLQNLEMLKNKLLFVRVFPQHPDHQFCHIGLRAFCENFFFHTHYKFLKERQEMKDVLISLMWECGFLEEEILDFSYFFQNYLDDGEEMNFDHFINQMSRIAEEHWESSADLRGEVEEGEKTDMFFEYFLNLFPKQSEKKRDPTVHNIKCIAESRELVEAVWLLKNDISSQDKNELKKNILSLAENLLSKKEISNDPILSECLSDLKNNKRSFDGIRH